MPTIYAISDIVVNASSIEGLPMTILEAMAAKTALIVTPVGAIPKVISHDINGIMVDIGDFHGLANQICSLIDQPDRHRKLINQAYTDVCNNFNSETMVLRYKNIYQEVMDLI